MFFIISTNLVGFVIILIFGIIKKSKKLKKLSLLPLSISSFLILLYLFWYGKVIPNQNENTKNEYVGTYYLDGIRTNPKLILFNDYTFKIDTTKTLNFCCSGTWKTGMVNGFFGFYDLDGTLRELAYPSFGTINFNHMESNKLSFKK